MGLSQCVELTHSGLFERYRSDHHRRRCHGGLRFSRCERFLPQPGAAVSDRQICTTQHAARGECGGTHEVSDVAGSWSRPGSRHGCYYCAPDDARRTADRTITRHTTERSAAAVLFSGELLDDCVIEDWKVFRGPGGNEVAIDHELFVSPGRTCIAQICL